MLEAEPGRFSNTEGSVRALLAAESRMAGGAASVSAVDVSKTLTIRHPKERGSFRYRIDDAVSSVAAK
jgi:hypothetical protein